jgi:hypothetical protein
MLSDGIGGCRVRSVVRLRVVGLLGRRGRSLYHTDLCVRSLKDPGAGVALFGSCSSALGRVVTVQSSSQRSHPPGTSRRTRGKQAESDTCSVVNLRSTRRTATLSQIARVVKRNPVAHPPEAAQEIQKFTVFDCRVHICRQGRYGARRAIVCTGERFW